jgi:hypothetical protein
MDLKQVDPKRIVAEGYDRIAEQYCAWASQVRREERAKYTSVYSLLHVPHHEQPGLLHHIAAWLRTGGVLVATMWPHATEATFAEDWLGAPMYWSGFDSETSTRLIAAAGLHLLRAEEETVEEFGVPITFLWVIAEKPAQAHAKA